MLLLFLVLNQMTGAFWQSAFVASLFAIHPLHVESVAWVSERKDVLSAVFFMLTLGAYLRYARQPSVGRYLIVALLFALGLMSKPMLVTLPFVLLLLDYWPLGRLRGQKSEVGRRLRRLITEKIPLFALSALSCTATLLATYSTEASEQLPFMWRLNTAAVSYVAYIWQMFWPARLAAFYPHPNDQLPFWQVLLAIAFLISVSLLAILCEKKTTVHFHRLVLVCRDARACDRLDRGRRASACGSIHVPPTDRLIRPDYLGHLRFGGAHNDAQSGSRSVTSGPQPTTRGSRGVRTNGPAHHGYKPICAAVAAAIILALSWRAFVQTSYWKNSEMLWNHTLAVTTDNDMAHNNLGHLFLRRNELDSAVSHFEAALEIRSRTTAAHYNPGGALIETNLGTALARKGRLNRSNQPLRESDETAT